jgi:prepilin signal peptidase PulO-like enzyme (type II secretory pathway)
MLVSVLIVITGIDITHGIIPNKVILTGIILVVPMVIGFSVYRGQPGRIGLAAVTAASGSAFFMLAGLLYGLVFMRSTAGSEKGAGSSAPDYRNGKGDSTGDMRRYSPVDGEDQAEGDDLPTGIGMGDVKLMLFTGLVLGYFHWYFLIVQIFLSTLIGAVSFIPLKLFAGKGRKDRVPFGPFLSVGALLALVWGQAIVDAYLKLLR